MSYELLWTVQKKEKTYLLIKLMWNSSLQLKNYRKSSALAEI
jgi:hypothetical protein